MGDRQFWINTWIDPRSAAESGRRLEADGFDGVSLVDNQSVAPDPFVVLGLVAAATERLQLATGTSNPVTRHPAALAAAAATVAAASGDRMLLSIGRGLSANFEIGLPPSPLPAFEQYLRDLCGYVRGERVEQHGTPSSLKWLRRYGVSGVPVEVTATGPKVIAAAAVLADRLAFAVGTDAARVRWAVETARAARRRAGLDPDGIRYGAYVQTFPHPDVERAIAMARGPVSGLASLSGMAGNDGAGQAPEDREQFRLINEVYDKRRHILTSAPQAQAIDPEFVRRFAAVGSVDEVVERLRTVLDAGVDRLYLSFPGPDSDPDDAAETARLLREQVLPALRSL